MGTVSGNVVSEIKLGKLVETLRILQGFGMVDEDLRRLRKDYDLAIEVFRVIRDHEIFRSKYTKEYRRSGHVEKFAEWNKELCLGIPEEDFKRIPEKFPEPPACSVDGLFCTCLMYEWENPLQTLLNGFRILDYELRKLNGELCLEQQIGGIFNGEKNEMFLPETISPAKVRTRPEAHTRNTGFRFIIAELGRATRPCSRTVSREIRGKYFKDLFGHNKIKFLGQELPYIAAMYPSWITSMCGDSGLYPRPLALDVQILGYSRKGFAGADKYIDLFDDLGGLQFHEDMNSDYPPYAKNKPFEIEASSFKYDYYRGGNGTLDRGYGICTIVDETK